MEVLNIHKDDRGADVSISCLHYKRIFAGAYGLLLQQKYSGMLKTKFTDSQVPSPKLFKYSLCSSVKVSICIPIE